MSAFVVSHTHINALLTFADLKRVTSTLGDLANLGERADLTAIGRVLLAENLRSVLHRYPDDTEDTAPGKAGETVASYRFKTWNQAFRLPHDTLCVWIIKACDCFDYQACETDDYPQSAAFKIIEYLRSHAWHNLTAYAKAPWGIDEDKAAGAKIVRLV